MCDRALQQRRIQATETQGEWATITKGGSQTWCGGWSGHRRRLRGYGGDNSGRGGLHKLEQVSTLRAQSAAQHRGREVTPKTTTRRCSGGAAVVREHSTSPSNRGKTGSQGSPWSPQREMAAYQTAAQAQTLACASHSMSTGGGEAMHTWYFSDAATSSILRLNAAPAGVSAGGSAVVWWKTAAGPQSPR